MLIICAQPVERKKQATRYNKRVKEKDLIKKCVEHLEAGHCKIWWKSPSFKRMRWDIFTIFDLIVIDAYDKIIFIQVTSLSNLSIRRRKIQSYFKKHNLIIPNSYVFAWDKRKGEFKIQEIKESGF